MIKKNFESSVIYMGCFLMCALFISCIQMKSISKGQLNDQLKYNYSYFGYSKVSSGSGAQSAKTQMKSCRVYLADIRNSQNRILEKMVWYPCSNKPPFKIKLDYDAKGKLTEQNYFITVLDSSYTIQATFDEKWLFLEMSKHHMPEDYADYPLISGFRPATSADSVEALPFLKDVTKGKVM